VSGRDGPRPLVCALYGLCEDVGPEDGRLEAVFCVRGDPTVSKGSNRRPPRVREEVIERNWRRTFSEGVRKYVARKVARVAYDEGCIHGSLRRVKGAVYCDHCGYLPHLDSVLP